MISQQSQNPWNMSQEVRISPIKDQIMGLKVDLKSEVIYLIQIAIMCRPYSVTNGQIWELAPLVSVTNVWSISVKRINSPKESLTEAGREKKMTVLHKGGTIYFSLSKNSTVSFEDSVLAAAIRENSFDFYVCIVSVCNGSLGLHVY